MSRRSEKKFPDKENEQQRTKVTMNKIWCTEIGLIIIIIMSICTAPRLSGALCALQSSFIAMKIHLYKSHTHTSCSVVKLKHKFLGQI